MALQTNSSRQRRLVLGWSIEDLAQRSGVPIHLLIRHEQGHYLTPAQRRKLARVFGCSADDMPEREPWAQQHSGTDMAPAVSVWERASSALLHQPVELSAAPRPGETLRGHLAAGDPTALLVQTARAGTWHLVPVARVLWLRGDPAGLVGTGWSGAQTPTLWRGVLGEWVGYVVTARLLTGELVPARLLAGDDTAILVDRAGVETILPASALCWVKYEV